MIAIGVDLHADAATDMPLDYIANTVASQHCRAALTLGEDRIRTANSRA